MDMPLTIDMMLALPPSPVEFVRPVTAPDGSTGYDRPLNNYFDFDMGDRLLPAQQPGKVSFHLPISHSNSSLIVSASCMTQLQTRMTRVSNWYLECLVRTLLFSGQNALPTLAANVYGKKPYCMKIHRITWVFVRIVLAGVRAAPLSKIDEAWFQ